MYKYGFKVDLDLGMPKMFQQAKKIVLTLSFSFLLSCSEHANATLLAKKHLDPLRDLYLGSNERGLLDKVKQCNECYKNYILLRREDGEALRKRQELVKNYGRQARQAEQRGKTSKTPGKQAGQLGRSSFSFNKK